MCTGAQTHSRRAASILWRVATDCDKAKLEVAKAGVVAPAVAMLQRGCRDHSAAPAAIEVHNTCQHSQQVALAFAVRSHAASL